MLVIGSEGVDLDCDRDCDLDFGGDMSSGSRQPSTFVSQRGFLPWRCQIDKWIGCQSRIWYARDGTKGCMYYLNKSSKCRIDLRSRQVSVQKFFKIISLFLHLVPLSMNRNSQVRQANREWHAIGNDTHYTYHKGEHRSIGRLGTLPHSLVVILSSKGIIISRLLQYVWLKSRWAHRYTSRLNKPTKIVGECKLVMRPEVLVPWLSKSQTMLEHVYVTAEMGRPILDWSLPLPIQPTT